MFKINTLILNGHKYEHDCPSSITYSHNFLMSVTWSLIVLCQRKKLRNACEDFRGLKWTKNDWRLLTQKKRRGGYYNKKEKKRKERSIKGRRTGRSPSLEIQIEKPPSELRNNIKQPSCRRAYDQPRPPPTTSQHPLDSPHNQE